MALSILLHPPTALWRREALAASRGTFWVRMDGASSLRIYNAATITSSPLPTSWLGRIVPGPWCRRGGRATPDIAIGHPALRAFRRWLPAPGTTGALA